MPFENFYKESDAAHRRWWKFFGLAFLLLIGYWSISLLLIPDFKSDRKTAEYLSDEERVRRVDDLCRYLPLPEQFFLTWKADPKVYPNSTFIVYHYRSDRQPEEIMPFFLIWFKSNGWKPISGTSSMFTKDKLIVSINISKPFDVVTGYEIQCTETE